MIKVLRVLSRVLCAGVLFSALGASAQSSDFNRTWHKANSSIVLDAYEYTPIDWSKMRNNKRLAGFINKASDGLSPSPSCKGNSVCRLKWRRYSATRELYHTRKAIAKELGMKWGAYHLARPGNPVKQAHHFLDFTKPDKDDLLALDIEHNDPSKWMSLGDGEIFARVIKRRTGRYPILYTNHSTSKFIAANKEKYPLLSRLNLWYARYKPSMQGAFPMGHWKSYTLWQFSSMVNCSDRSCPWRINGAGNWIDVNVVAMSPEKLRKAWPFAKLRAGSHQPELIAKVDKTLVGAVPAKPEALSLNSNSILAQLSDKAAQSAFPKWRPGAVLTKRKAARFSDDILAAFHEVRKLPTSPARKVATSDDAVVEEWKKLAAAGKNTEQQPKLPGLFPVEAVVFKTTELDVSKVGPVRASTGSI